MRIIFIILFLLLVVSCNKERSIHVKAINPVTNELYSDLRVVITSSKTGFDGEVVKTVYDGTLNSNGEVMVPLRIKKNRFYIIRCEQPVNTCYTKDLVQYYAIQDEENPSFLFEYAECAHLKLKIENVNCEGPDDHIFFRRTWLSNNSSGSGVNQYGCFNYEGDFFDLPEGEYMYYWEVTRNSITESYDSIFTIEKGEYKEFEINY